MKPKNFPGRKNQRRKDAVANIDWNYSGREMPYNIKSIREQTLSKIISDEDALRIRTKKHRG